VRKHILAIRTVFKTATIILPPLILPYRASTFARGRPDVFDNWYRSESRDRAWFDEFDNQKNWSLNLENSLEILNESQKTNPSMINLNFLILISQAWKWGNSDFLPTSLSVIPKDPSHLATKWLSVVEVMKNIQYLVFGCLEGWWILDPPGGIINQIRDSCQSCISLHLWALTSSSRTQVPCSVYWYPSESGITTVVSASYAQIHRYQRNTWSIHNAYQRDRVMHGQ